jgi:hypothetical protein
MPNLLLQLLVQTRLLLTLLQQVQLNFSAGNAALPCCDPVTLNRVGVIPACGVSASFHSNRYYP